MCLCALTLNEYGSEGRADEIWTDVAIIPGETVEELVVANFGTSDAEDLSDVADIAYGFNICSDIGAAITIEFVGADAEDFAFDKFVTSDAEEFGVPVGNCRGPCTGRKNEWQTS